MRDATRRHRRSAVTPTAAAMKRRILQFPLSEQERISEVDGSSNPSYENDNTYIVDHMNDSNVLDQDP